MRVGQGYDIHRLADGRPLVLGTLRLQADRGCEGHSDGDPVAHAVCDAILGALALGDMGIWFPSSDERWKDAPSSLFLIEIKKLVAERGARLLNVDVTVVLAEPRLGGHLSAMGEALAGHLGCDHSRVSVKAKSGDGLGAAGRGEAIEAMAVALVETGED